MAKYCRYCRYCICDDDIYCTYKEKVMSEKTAKRANRCVDFQFVNIDAFDETDGYKPRPRKQIDGQMTLF